MRLIASVCLVVAGIGFLVGGIGLLAKQAWWLPVTWVTAAFSSLIFILFWDGKFGRLADKGWCFDQYLDPSLPLGDPLAFLWFLEFT